MTSRIDLLKHKNEEQYAEKNIFLWYKSNLIFHSKVIKITWNLSWRVVNLCYVLCIWYKSVCYPWHQLHVILQSGESQNDNVIETRFWPVRHQCVKIFPHVGFIGMGLSVNVYVDGQRHRDQEDFWSVRNKVMKVTDGLAADPNGNPFRPLER